jgi:hypothetical protein
MKKLDWGKPRMVKGLAIGAIAALLILFATLSFTAARTKSATYDEPLHAVAGWVRRTTGDFRMNQEDPALFGYWGSLPHSRDALTLNTDLVWWDKMLRDFNNQQWHFIWWTLYKTPGVDADAFLQRSRFMFVIVGVAMGAVIAWWSWQLAGMWAALTATALFALDPNFLAHSALVKNDVMLSLMFVAMALALWRFGRRGTWLSLAGLALSCAAAVNVKFSGILCGPIICAALLIRALLPGDWTVVGMTLGARWKRLLVVPAVCLLCAITSYTTIWACYGFRFVKTTDPNAIDDTKRLVALVRLNKAKATFTGAWTREELQERFDAQKAGFVPDTISWALSKRLLPEGWLHGFLYTYATTQVRSTFLLGQVNYKGRWYYFPCAMLFKTPTATLAAIPLSIVGVILAVFVGRRRPANAAARTPFGWWTLTCLGLPVCVYLASAMTTNLNLGLRHILPLYPFLFVALGVAVARIARWELVIGSNLALLIALGVAIESLRTYPNYLTFFNTPTGGAAGGIKRLGDSNLDWGQDLKLLAKWQKEHTDKPLFLAYFGIADPSAYGVNAIHLAVEQGGWPFAHSPQAVDRPCYLAVSATNLQGIYIDNVEVRKFYSGLLKDHEPLAVLGGTIYIYEIPLRRSAA